MPLIPQDPDKINRAKEEIYRLHKEIKECAHCKSLMEQIVRLMDCIPPAPALNQAGTWFEYTGPVADLPEDLK